MTVKTILVFCLGVIIGLVPGIYKVNAMRAEIQDRASVVVMLHKQMHNEEVYFRRELETLRARAGIRRVTPTEIDRASGMFCAEEYGPASGPGSGVRSWRPRSDGRCYSEDAP